MNFKRNARLITCAISAVCVLESHAPLHAVALHSFTNFNNFFQTNYDGSEPQSNPLLSGTNFYGTTTLGGAYGQRAVFAVSTNGSGLTNLHNSSDFGANPLVKLTLANLIRFIGCLRAAD